MSEIHRAGQNVAVDWADDRVKKATTVHLGGKAAEIRLAEAKVNAGRIPDRPIVMVVQPELHSFSAPF